MTRAAGYAFLAVVVAYVAIGLVAVMSAASNAAPASVKTERFCLFTSYGLDESGTSIVALGSRFLPCRTVMRWVET
jgi:hypothetical protein